MVLKQKIHNPGHFLLERTHNKAKLGPNHLTFPSNSFNSTI